MTQEPPPPTVLQLAFTYAGLRALELPDDIAAAFSMEFVDGMSGNANRSRRLGDVGPNDATQWLWGAAGRIPHVARLSLCVAGSPQGVAGRR